MNKINEKNERTGETTFVLDFSIFFYLFFQKALNYGYTVPSMLCAIFDDRIANTTASSYKTGQKPIGEALVSRSIGFSHEQLAIRFEQILTGKKREFEPEFNDEICNELLDSCEANMCSLIKLAKIRLLEFRNSQTLSSLEDNSISIYSKIAFLFIESLPVTKGEYIPQDYDKIKEWISGAYLPSRTSDLPKSFKHLYYIYYYSEHYENEIHCGLLNIYDDDLGNPCARYIYGLTSIDILKNEYLLKSMFEPSNAAAKDWFEKYVSTVSTGYDRRVYLMNGVVESTDYSYYLKINFSGVGNRSNDAQTLYLNLSRVSNSYIPKNRYYGGLGFIITVPYKTVPKIRVYRIGVADSNIPISLKNRTLRKLLKLNPTDKQRLQVQMDDDREFWNFLLKCENKATRRLSSKSNDDTASQNI